MSDAQPSETAELLKVVEEANDLLAEALHDANIYCGHDDVRPSAIRAFDKVQEAHNALGEIDPTRGDEDDE